VELLAGAAERQLSGVFAIVDTARRLPDVEGLCRRMCTAMSHREWFVGEWCSAAPPHVAFGRIGIGLFNRAPQPVWTPDRALAAVMAGEVYDGGEPGTGGAAAASDPAQVLRAYARHGESFARAMNGAFAVAVWDARRRRLLIANDRFGLYPVFFSRRPGTVVCAPEMKAILADATLARRLDLTALAQYMRFQHLLGERTFFEGIELLPPASVLCVDADSGDCAVTTYWTPADIPDRPDLRFEPAVEECGALLRRAVRRHSSGDLRPGVYLSGGMDSRTILGLIERRPVTSIVYGQPGCRDVQYAARVARQVGSEHHWHRFEDGRWVRDYADLHLELTEGYHSWLHAHGISTLAEARARMDVNLSGWDGGTVMGHVDSVEPLQTDAVDDAALTTHLFELMSRRYTWPSVTEAEELCLYREPLSRQLRGRAFESFRDEMGRFLHYRRDVRGELFTIRNHCGRFTHNHIVFQRSHMEVRFPYFDYDLFDFLFAIPARLRGHKVLYRAVMQRELPRLARIPYDRDLLPPTTKVIPQLLSRTGRFLRHRVNRHVYPVFRQARTLYADYEAYARDELRGWIEDILFDKRTEERGLFDPAFVRTLVERHYSGLEQWTIGKIAPLVTYEMMLRRFHD
jgi:asparagine synthase (glutamine-hydrolysing)